MADTRASGAAVDADQGVAVELGRHTGERRGEWSFLTDRDAGRLLGISDCSGAALAEAALHVHDQPLFVAHAPLEGGQNNAQEAFQASRWT